MFESNFEVPGHPFQVGEQDSQEEHHLLFFWERGAGGFRDFDEANAEKLLFPQRESRESKFTSQGTAGFSLSHLPGFPFEHTQIEACMGKISLLQVRNTVNGSKEDGECSKVGRPRIRLDCYFDNFLGRRTRTSP